MKAHAETPGGNPTSLVLAGIKPTSKTLNQNIKLWVRILLPPQLPAVLIYAVLPQMV